MKNIAKDVNKKIDTMLRESGSSGYYPGEGRPGKERSGCSK